MDNSGNISTTELRGALAKAGKSDLVSHQSQDLYSHTHLIHTHNSDCLLLLTAIQCCE